MPLIIARKFVDSTVKSRGIVPEREVLCFRNFRGEDAPLERMVVMNCIIGSRARGVCRGVGRGSDV